MRGADRYDEAIFTTMKLEDLVPANHPLRPTRTWINEALSKMYAAADQSSGAGAGPVNSNIERSF